MRPSSTQATARPGFSLIELLVVIAIIAILISLIVAGAQQARESANKAVCANHLRQIGIASNSHVMVHGRFPSGGWGIGWLGEPDRGTDQSQPGGWVFNILHYTEHTNLRDMGKGLTDPQKGAAIIQRVEMPVAMFNCPSRRSGGPWPRTSGWHVGPFVSGTVVKAARTDYAGNVGDANRNEIFAGPSSLAQGDNPNYAWNNTSGFTGIFFERSWIRQQDITKGLSNIYLAGEKYLNPDHYYSGNGGADNEGMYTGFNNDNYRCTGSAPLRDKPGVSDTFRFGANHKMGCNMVMCDGSVRFVPYTIDPAVHKAAGNRYAY